MCALICVFLVLELWVITRRFLFWLAAFNSYLRVCRLFQDSALSSAGSWSDSLEGVIGKALQGVVINTLPELLGIVSKLENLDKQFLFLKFLCVIMWFLSDIILWENLTLYSVIQSLGQRMGHEFIYSILKPLNLLPFNLVGLTKPFVFLRLWSLWYSPTFPRRVRIRPGWTSLHLYYRVCFVSPFPSLPTHYLLEVLSILSHPILSRLNIFLALFWALSFSTTGRSWSEQKTVIGENPQ